MSLVPIGDFLSATVSKIMLRYTDKNIVGAGTRSGVPYVGYVATGSQYGEKFCYANASNDRL